MGELEAISESQNINSPIPMPMYARADVAASAVPVEAGEMTFEIGVNVQWELDNKAN